MPTTNFIAFFRRSPYFLAVLCMIVSTACFSAMGVCIRLASEDMHGTAIVAFRNAITILILTPFVLRDVSILRTRRLSSHFWRAAVGIVGMETWFYCIIHLPLNQATALSFTAPLFTSLFAVIFLKEKSDRSRWIALGVGFIGMLIILRPHPSSFEWNSLFVILTTTLWATAGMLVKSLTRTERPLAIIYYMSVFMFLWAVPIALPNWSWPSNPHIWALLLLTALCSTGAHWTLVKAYSLAGVVQVMPFDFLRLIFTAIFAYIVFHETSDAYAWIGSAIIIASAASIARRDAKAAQAVVHEEVDLMVPKR